jgi:uncharacterized tellurite resistance protein B-like protein
MDSKCVWVKPNRLPIGKPIHLRQYIGMPKERQKQIIFEVLCCVMVADGKASRDEKLRLVKIMNEYGCDWSTEEIGQRLTDFVSRVRADGFHKVLNAVCQKAERLDDDHAAQLVEKCHQLARTDDDYTERERDTVQKIETRLNQLAFIRRQLQTPVKSDNRFRTQRQASHPVVWIFFAVVMGGCAFGLAILFREPSAVMLAWLSLAAAVGTPELIRRLWKRQKERLQVLLNAPRNGLVIADGYIYPKDNSDLIRCIWSDRECVSYATVLYEHYEVDGENGPVMVEEERFRDTKTVPFVIRSEFGEATVNSDVIPVQSEFQSDWKHYKDEKSRDAKRRERLRRFGRHYIDEEYNDEESRNPSARFYEIFRSLYGRSSMFLLKKQGYLSQSYCDLLPGQYVSILGRMTVQSTGGREEGCFLDGGKFSTRPDPDFKMPRLLKWFLLLLYAFIILVPLPYLLITKLPE